MSWKDWSYLGIISLSSLLVGCSQSVNAPITSIQPVAAMPAAPTHPLTVSEQVATQSAQYGGQTAPVHLQNALPAKSVNFAPAAPSPSPNTSATPGKVYVAAKPVPNGPTTAVNQNARNIANQLVSQADTPASPVNVQAGETLGLVSVSTAGSVTNDGITWSWPVSGQITEKFGQGAGLFSKGIQVATAKNAKVLAAADGSVTFSGVGVNGYRNMIIIKSADNFLTAYTNLSSLLVKQGQKVKRGETIGVVGMINGKATLHFEMRKFGNPVNPLKYMPSGK